MKFLFSSMFLVGAANSLKMEGFMDKADIPETGKDWVSLDNGVEFLAGPDLDPRVDHVRKLWSDSTSSGPYSTMFVDGGETYFDEYAQAWRVVGWYIDCDFCDEDSNVDHEFCNADNQRRQLDQGEQQADQQIGCPRFLLWAAYVDLNYEGNGGYEYQYYNRNTHMWDGSSCRNNKRCVRMDCHLPKSNFELIGFFKEPKYDEWMQQLVTYQGDCTWNDDEFKVMQSVHPMSLINSCTESITTDETTGNYLYFTITPMEYANIDIGLYTDASCVEEYKGTYTAESVVGVLASIYNPANEGDDDADADGGDNEDEDNVYYTNKYILDLIANIDAWNNALDAFKICQPCKAYDLTNLVAFGYRADTTLNVDGDRYPVEQVCNDDNDCSDEVVDGTFICSNEYNDINQCMMFRDNTEMMSSTFKDVELAGQQGTITAVALNGFYYGQSEGMRYTREKRAVGAWIYLFASAALFGYAGAGLYKARRRNREQELAEPLILSPKGEVA